MLAEAQEFMVCSKEIAQIIKGKRTKRQRPASPGLLSSGESDTTSTGESIGEEEDMANCLILLAKGHRTKNLSAKIAGNSYKGSHGLDVYECKTCSRSFPSFQALGGHRASHKKLLPNKSNNVIEDQFHEEMSTTLSLQIARNNNHSACSNVVRLSNKVHECSICGAEFASGQALGGHMRRHRAVASTSTVNVMSSSTVTDCQESKKPRSSLQLDLNQLPAPEDDLRETKKFRFPSKEQVLVFSTSPLVDCHY